MSPSLHKQIQLLLIQIMQKVHVIGKYNNEKSKNNKML